MIGIFSNWGPLSADLPDVGNVLNTDTVGGQAGTFAPASVADVRDGTFYGADGTQYEGSLVVTGTTGIFFLRRR